VNTVAASWRWRAIGTALFVPPLIRLVSLSRLLAWLEPAHRSRVADDAALDDTALARWVDDLLLRLPGPWRRTCLNRSAILYHLLRRAGRPVELVIGVRRSRNAGSDQASETGDLAAHAWLVREGHPYLEWSSPEHLQEHVTIARFPGGSAPS